MGTRPSKKKVQALFARISEMTSCRTLLKDTEAMVGQLNRLLRGWANYFCLGPVSDAYHAVDAHVTSRLRRWLCKKHKVSSGGYSRYSYRYLTEQLGLVRLPLLRRRYPRANA
ncbi:MAG TPA: group II intron maturase-specific domain-containing protein [Phycisphaerae bacterium]|nr:group II intron maturase-specific domain-containing protein [Phycisphaerae bacterium]